MSEYQYYEFLAIDRPLTEAETAELRSFSTRATITPVSFTNFYNWGGLKADPDRLLERYFDAHVYWSDWGSALFMVRIPIDMLPKEIVQAVAVPYTLYFKATKKHWLVTWNLEEAQDYERFAENDGSSWMSRLTPIRDELLRGDLRSLYIGWLADISENMMDDDEVEPFLPAGLQELTAAQRALAEFLEVDPDLLAGAGMGTPAAPKPEVSRKLLDAWISSLPRTEVDAVIRDILEGKGPKVERSLRNRFASWSSSTQTDDADDAEEKPRTIAKIRANAEIAREARKKKVVQDSKIREKNRRKKREAELKALSNDFAKAWGDIIEPVKRGSGAGYDEACRRIVDLSEAYTMFSTESHFRKALQDFMLDHLHRKALIRRLVDAGLWTDGE